MNPCSAPDSSSDVDFEFGIGSSPYNANTCIFGGKARAGSMGLAGALAAGAASCAASAAATADHTPLARQRRRAAVEAFNMSSSGMPAERRFFLCMSNSSNMRELERRNHSLRLRHGARSEGPEPPSSRAKPPLSLIRKNERAFHGLELAAEALVVSVQRDHERLAGIFDLGCQLRSELVRRGLRPSPEEPSATLDGEDVQRRVLIVFRLLPYQIGTRETVSVQLLTQRGERLLVELVR